MSTPVDRAPDRAIRVPRRLPAPATTWRRSTDVIVIGSGVAGMMSALTAARSRKVLLVTKEALDAGSTSWAQGGIAAAIDVADAPAQHFDDTVVAGAGLCSEHAVRVLVEEGPQQLARLIGYGAQLDTDDSGSLSLTREGGHNRNRIVHAGGDATGAEVQRALQAAVSDNTAIEVLEHAFILDAVWSVPDGEGKRRIAGVRASVRSDDGTESIGLIEGRAVVLACGGIGQVFATTTNPPVATGDGMALALRAGAALADVEFVQFHPTVLYQGPDASGQQLLVSEALRGEGAFLIDATGARVMEGVHPLADLAPRDVVAKAMSVRMAQAPGGIDSHLFLDARGIGEEKLLRRFPNIVAGCRAAGIDPVTEPIPVAPGEHFACGGVWTDCNGRTSIPGLYAVGETACTGVHGANRLASNSLLEGLVFGDRVGSQVVLNLPPAIEPDPVEHGATTDETTTTTGSASTGAVFADAARTDIATAMSRHAGVRRTAAGLEIAAKELAAITGDAPAVTRAGWEAANVHALATVLVESARTRAESRGCHWREDHPATDDGWRRRVVARLDDADQLTQRIADLEEGP